MTTNGNPEYVFLDTQMVPYRDACVHIMTPCVKYGQLVFEGIRAYWNDTDHQLYLFRLRDHSRRLLQSCALMRYDHLFAEDTFSSANISLLRELSCKEDMHIRQMVFLDGDGRLGARGPVRMAAVALPRGRNVDAVEGLHVSISSWIRIDDTSMPPRIKAAANYHNGRLGLLQAQLDGYDSTIFLNKAGKVAEGSGACVFMVRDSVAVTPPVTSGILESITRSTLMEISATELNMCVFEREIDRTELYTADEVFFCGTGAEVTPILSIDRHEVGNGGVGHYTERLREAYLNVARGSHQQYRCWLTPVYEN